MSTTFKFYCPTFRCKFISPTPCKLRKNRIVTRAWTVVGVLELSMQTTCKDCKGPEGLKRREEV
jgi:hypothetical protein